MSTAGATDILASMVWPIFDSSFPLRPCTAHRTRDEPKTGTRRRFIVSGLLSSTLVITVLGGLRCDPADKVSRSARERLSTSQACVFLLKTSPSPSRQCSTPSKVAKAGSRRSSFGTKRGRHGPVTTGPFQGVGRGLHGDGARGSRGPRREPGPDAGPGSGSADQACESGPERLPVLLRRVRHAGAHRRGEDRQHRGRSPEPPQRRDPVPEGGGDLSAPREPEPRHQGAPPRRRDRKSTRLNSSHGYISYAVFCLKKKKNKEHDIQTQSTNNNK